MPAQPAWISRLEDIVAALEALPLPWVDRATVETLLEVGLRRAQQLMAPCVTRRVGTSGLADRDQLVARLRSVAVNEATQYEVRRRTRLAQQLVEWHQERRAHPSVTVEMPSSVVDQEVADLPNGVELQPGTITLRFASPDEALQQLMALALAIGNDRDRFEQRVAVGTRADISRR